MDDSRILAADVTTMLGPALTFGVGAIMVGFATLTAWTTAYMNANAAVGGVSGGSTLAVLGIVAVGTVVMFLSACDALARIRENT